MLDDLDNLGIISDRLAEREARAEARGRAEEARQFLLQMLTARFGGLPESLTERIHHAEREWCEALGVQAMRVETIPELEAAAEQLAGDR